MRNVNSHRYTNLTPFGTLTNDKIDSRRIITTIEFDAIKDDFKDNLRNRITELKKIDQSINYEISETSLEAYYTAPLRKP
jgi:hypothetical protein